MNPISGEEEKKFPFGFNWRGPVVCSVRRPSSGPAGSFHGAAVNVTLG